MTLNKAAGRNGGQQKSSAAYRTIFSNPQNIIQQWKLSTPQNHCGILQQSMTQDETSIIFNSVLAAELYTRLTSLH